MVEGRGDGEVGLPLTRTQEVVASSGWLVAMRWVAGVGVVVGVWVVRRTLLPGLEAAGLVSGAPDPALPNAPSATKRLSLSAEIKCFPFFSI